MIQVNSGENKMPSASASSRWWISFFHPSMSLFFLNSAWCTRWVESVRVTSLIHYKIMAAGKTQAQNHRAIIFAYD